MVEKNLTFAPAVNSLEHRDDELITGEAVALDVRPASFILRGAGAAIDFVYTIGLFLALIYLLILGAVTADIDEALAQALFIATFVFCIVVVPLLVETLTRGRSLGKVVIGARIVRDDGGASSFRHAFIRALTGPLEIYLTFGGLAILVSLLNAKSKRLGDLLAGTYSQHERVPAVTASALALPAQLVAWAPLADVAKLPDRLARRIAQYLAQASKMTPQIRERLSAELAREALPFVSPLPDVHPEVLLVGIAVLRRDREYRGLILDQKRLDRLTPVLTGLPHGFPDR